MIQAWAALEAQQPLQPFEYDPGPLAATDVEIEIRHCGICHSDLSMIDNEWGVSRYPLVPGHEVVGTVSQVGPLVKHLKPGQTVGLGWHAGYCNQCYLCLDGDHNLCQRARPTIIGRYGGFADRVRASSNSVVALPDGLDPASAGPLFCGGITVFNPLLQYDIPPLAKVAVVGIGGLGSMALQFLRAWGCEVTAFTSSEAKRTEALQLGAHHTLNSRNADEIAAAANRFDLIISTVNVRLEWALYINTLRPKGRLHFAGAMNEPLSVNLVSLMSAQRTISSSPVGSPGAIAKMLEFAKRHRIVPVVETFAFDEVNAALEHLRSGQARYRVVLTR